MNILRIYTLDYLRRNKRTMFSIMIAILLVTTMLSALCGICVTTWSDNVRLSLEESGNWHGELFDATFGRDLDLIENYASVETTLIKGPWSTTLLDSTDKKRPYLVSRDANAEYWASMSEKNLITRGRIPQKTGELALSKQYFDAHPETQIGDVWTLPLGDRIVNNTALDETAPFTDGETFKQTGTITYTIVGELDVATPSTTPAYTALGYLDESSIAPDDQITVYLRFQNMRDTYKELPKIAAALGWQTDEYGRYSLKYNSTYLGHYLIFPEGLFQNLSLSQLSLPLSALILAVLVVSVFVLIIHNSFAVSATARLRHLGILSSIGATPRQIKQSILFEGMLLTVIPLPLGLFLGWILDAGMFSIINSAQSMRDAGPVTFTYGLPACIPAIVLTLITVYLSARIPARQISKLSPITAIRQGDSLQLKNSRKHPILHRVFGLTGELSACALDARRKSYRTATLSLILSFTVLTSIFYILSIQEASEVVYPTKENQISFTTQNGMPLTAEQMEQLRALPNIASISYYSQIPFSISVPESMQTEALRAADGSFTTLASNGKFYMTKQPDDTFRLKLSVHGLDHKTFRHFCETQGIDPEPYFTDKSRIILYNQTLSDKQSTRRTPVYYPILNLSTGDTLTLHERIYNSDESDQFQPQVTIGDFSEELPPLIFSEHYNPIAIVPLESAQNLAMQNNNRKLRGMDLHGIAAIKTAPDAPEFFSDIRATAAQLDAALDRSHGSGDYYIVDIAEKTESRQNANRLVKICTTFISLLLAFIGLSNIASTVSSSLRQRRREFAMLRSTGLSPHGLHKMLLLEALFLGLRPVLWSIPLQVGVIAAFLFITEVHLIEYLPFFPILPLTIFLLFILITIVLCYVIGGKHLQAENILDSLRDDIL